MSGAYSPRLSKKEYFSKKYLTITEEIASAIVSTEDYEAIKRIINNDKVINILNPWLPRILNQILNINFEKSRQNKNIVEDIINHLYGQRKDLPILNKKFLINFKEKYFPILNKINQKLKGNKKARQIKSEVDSLIEYIGEE